MSPFCHETDEAQDGRSGEDVTEDQDGSPERDIEVTFQERAVADLQIREPKVCPDQLGTLRGVPDESLPRKPLPPHTTR